jgi:SPP1 gp7 family putative phage head morphogenesis protein
MASQIVTEIDSIIHLLEAQLPASMENPANKKLEAALKKSVANYFTSLTDAFPYQKLEHLYISQVKEVSVPKAPPAGEWDEWLDSLLNAFKFQLVQSVSGHMITIYLAGSTQMMSYGTTKLGIPILYEGPPISQAVNWASKYCAQMVTKMDEETKSRLAQVISDGIDNKRGVEGLSRDIRKEFTDMSKDRADMIAQTETNAALSQGSMERMQAMGVDGKEWVVIGDDAVCEICDGNAAQGVIPIDQPFQSGDMQTPGHPRCRCATAPARLGRKD